MFLGDLDPATRLGRGRVWVYHPTTEVRGVEKLLEIVQDPAAQLVLAGEVPDGGVIVVSVVDGKLQLRATHPES